MDNPRSLDRPGSLSGSTDPSQVLRHGTALYCQRQNSPIVVRALAGTPSSLASGKMNAASPLPPPYPAGPGAIPRDNSYCFETRRSRHPMPSASPSPWTVPSRGSPSSFRASQWPDADSQSGPSDRPNPRRMIATAAYPFAVPGTSSPGRQSRRRNSFSKHDTVGNPQPYTACILLNPSVAAHSACLYIAILSRA